jgi:tryptophanase
MFASKEKETGEIIYPELELVRLAIPRRVYTSMHMQYVSESLTEIYDNRNEINGYKIEYEAEILRHFTARLSPL